MLENLSLIASINIGLDPTAFRLGPIAIHWYGIMYAVAIYVGVTVARRYVAVFGAEEEKLWDMLPWAIGAGLLGGRLYYVVQNRQSHYLHNPEDILAFWQGGMAFFGAIIAVAITIVIFARLNRLPLLPILDVAAIFGAIGQPLGRIGNIINGDIVGYPTNLPWGFVYTNPNTLAPQVGIAYQPAPLYEILANLVLILALWFVLRRWRPSGLAAGLYLLGYSISQFIVFFTRDNSITALGLKQAQLTSIVVFIVAMIFTALVLRRHDDQSDGTESQSPLPDRRISASKTRPDA